MPSQKVTPPKIFILFLTVITGLLSLIFLYPTGEIPVYADISLKFFSVQDLKPGIKDNRVDLSRITAKLENPEKVEDPENSFETAIPPVKLKVNDSVASDSCFIERKLKVEKTEFLFVDQKLELPPNKNDALINFFNGLDKVYYERKQIRILHYGDSQLEGDRITSSIRKYFQTNKNFNGCGVGLVALKENIYGRRTLHQNSSDNLEEFSVIKHKKKSPYGILGSIYRFNPTKLSTVENEQDTLANIQVSQQLEGINDSLRSTEERSLNGDSLTHKFAEQGNRELDFDSLNSVKMENNFEKENYTDNYFQGNFSYSRLRKSAEKSQQVNSLKLLYNKVVEPVKVDVSVNGIKTFSTVLSPTDEFSMLEWPVDQSFNKIEFNMQGNISPDFYAASLDCESGVSVDNIGIRGASIINFSKMEEKNLTAMLGALDVELVILQFGVNVVPYIAEDYKYYENMIYREIMALKKSRPEVSVLVIGLSDMSRKNGLDYESYPNIEKIRDAQRNAAFRSGSAFWDLYKAMGGRNSMVSWVENDPEYAAKDYTHFNNRGANIVGRMIYDALIYQYYEYKNIL